MKKRRAALLVLLYLFMLIFTLAMEWAAIQEILMRAIVNLATFVMAAFGTAGFVLLYRGERSGGETAQEEPEPVFDKELYLAFAKEKQFTKRETEIGLLVVNGYSNQRIAEELFISEATVKKHLTHIYEKSGISGRKELKEICLKSGD